MPELGSPPPERCTLTVKHLKRAVHDRPILQDISFAITTGEVLFVRGPSGVGKSLLLRCLAHLDPIQVSNIPGTCLMPLVSTHPLGDTQVHTCSARACMV